MQTLKLSALFLVCVGVAVLSGCVGEREYKDVLARNDTQANLIQELQSELETAKLKLGQLNRQLAEAQSRGSVDAETLQAQVDALEGAIREKNALIASMQGQLLGGGMLPPELSTMLEDFAKQHDVVSYDPGSGIVKFKSDLLFQPGSDVVAGSATEAIKALCGILNSEQGKQFDVIVAGHTDDIRIGRPATRAKHPTNWHLSVHRAISVRLIMASNGIADERTSVRGFGEFRPIAPNQPSKKGNPQNRRVEIYIVPKGA